MTFFFIIAENRPGCNSGVFDYKTVRTVCPGMCDYLCEVQRLVGEGEIKFYIDGDAEFPSICGTGTEDYFCGAYNFDVGGEYKEFTTPYSGMYKVGHTDGTYRAQRYFDLYRWHITDPIYFTEDLKVTIQALGWRKDWRYLPLQDDISSVAYWYSDTLEDVYPSLGDRDTLEIV